MIPVATRTTTQARWPRLPSSGCAAFTLIELLVALVIAVVVATVLVGLYGVVTRIVFDQQQRARGPHAASRALDQLGDDLGRAFLLAGETNDLFALNAGPAGTAAPGASQLSFLTYGQLEEENPAWVIAQRVQYRLETEGPLAAALVRIHQPLTGSGSLEPPITNALLREVATFTVEIFDGAAWQTMWTSAPGDARKPQAARIVLGSPKWQGDSPTQQAEFLIPAGLSTTSSLIRTGTRAE